MTLRCAILLLIWAPACGWTQERAPVAGCEATDPVEAIEAIHRAYMRAFNAGRIDQVVELHSDSVALMPAGVQPMRGRAALHELLLSSLQRAPEGFRFRFEASELRVGESWAVERGTTAPQTNPDGDDVPSGKYVLLYDREPDGCWRIAWSITNGNGPPGGDPAEE